MKPLLILLIILLTVAPVHAQRGDGSTYRCQIPNWFTWAIPPFSLR
jgi:hypothetical protein